MIGNMTHKNSTQKMLAILLAVIILVITAFSSFYIIRESHHDCAGTSCPICTVIAQCETNIRQISTGHITAITIMAVICHMLAVISVVACNSVVQTLITRKVRLND